MRREDGRAVFIGGSWGGLEASSRILAQLPRDFPAPVFLVLHQRQGSDNRLSWLLRHRIGMKVCDPEDKEVVRKGHLYVAPPGYHMLVDQCGTVAFSMGPAVHFSRPSIDETFFSGGHVYGRDAIGVILTGANEDGARGIRYIARRGGVTVAQSPESAEAGLMPRAAIETGHVQHVLDINDIAGFLQEELFGSVTT